MSIRIGFEEDESQLLEEQDGDITVRHGDGYKGKTEYVPVKIPERRKAQILEDFACVVVHEYDDDYHLSEEQRAANNRFYEAFKVIRKSKRSYRKLDQYISVVRDHLKCLDMIAEKNGVYDPEEFKSLFFKGKIYINGLELPKFKGRERKHISTEYLTEFILSDKDPSEIMPSRAVDDVHTEEELLEMANELFTEEELHEILRPKTEEERIEAAKFFDVTVDDQTGRNIAVNMDSKTTKKMMKAQPEIIYALKEIKRESRSIEQMSRFVYEIGYDDIEEIAKYDAKLGYHSDSDVPKFKGDILNDDDYNKYLQALKEYEREEVRYAFEGKLMTGERIEGIQLRSFLENHGWNVRNLYDNKEKEKKLQRLQRRERKQERELKKKLANVKERRKRRLGQDYDEDSKKKKGKNKKGKKSKKSKSKKEVD